MTTPAASPTAPRFQEIPRGQLHPSPFNPKERWHEPDPELAASIKQQGIIEPLIVRPRAQGGYEIVAGHRRWAAAKNLPTLPTIVRSLSDSQAAAVQLVENDQRKDLGAMARAQLYAQHLKAFGWTQEQLATVVSRTPAHVSQVLSLLELPEAGVRLVEQGKLAFTDAREIVRLKNIPDRQGHVLRNIEYGWTSSGKGVKEEVDRQLRYEAEEKARASRAAKEAEKAKQAALKARKKVRTDKKAIAAEKAEKAKRAREAAASKLEADRNRKIDAEVLVLVKEQAPVWAKGVRTLAATIRIPSPVTALMAKEDVLWPLLEDLVDGYLEQAGAHASEIFDAVRPRLAGKWSKVKPQDGKAQAEALALWFWLTSQGKKVDAGLEQLAAHRVAAAAKAAAVNPGKAPARKGGRK